MRARPAARVSFRVGRQDAGLPAGLSALALCLLLVLSWLLADPMPVTAQAGGGLPARIDEAIRQVEQAREGNGPLADPATLFPATEEVDWGGAPQRIDHSSLQAEWRAVPREGPGRRESLDRLRRRLVAVRAELDAPPQGAAVQLPADWRNRLTEVMARPELRKREVQESVGARIWRWLLDWLASWLPEGTRSGFGRIAPWVVYLLAGAAVLSGLVMLVRTILPFLARDRRRTAASPAARPASETVEALRQQADACARGGDFRGALQLAFRWLLLALNDAGWLAYDPALTNREHLSRLKADARRRAAFEALAGDYDGLWYGLHAVSLEEYTAFRQRCQRLAGRPA